jgi:NADH-quinone oxidoreductase subunit K
MVGQMFVIFVLVVAAAEAAIGLGLIIALFRIKGTLNMDEVKELKG